MQQCFNNDNLYTANIEKRKMPPHYHIILYVADQQRSRDFYMEVLAQHPTLDVAGMTEFTLDESLKLGLMPENGIAKILGDATPHPATGWGIPRCELYILTETMEEMYNRAIEAGGREVSAIELRSWGDTAGYIADPDGHIIAFAKRKE